MVDAMLSKETRAWDNLFVGYNVMPITEDVVLEMGQKLKRGAVVGKKTRALGIVTLGVNTGNGTISGVALKQRAQLGTYLLEMLSASAFKVGEPDGNRLVDGIVGTQYTNEFFTFILTAGTTPFAAGDKFYVPVVAGIGKAVLSLAAAVDGAHAPVGILGEDKDATLEDKSTFVYVRGEFNQERIVFGAGYTVSNIKDILQTKSIFLRAVTKE